MTAAAMTQKQRAAIEALEAVRNQGCSLTQYARDPWTERTADVRHAECASSHLTSVGCIGSERQCGSVAGVAHARFPSRSATRK